MGDSYVPLLFGAIGVPVVIGIVAWNLYAAKKKTEAWHAAAAQAGLTSTGHWPNISMHGSLAGVEVSLRQWTSRSGSGKNRQTHTHVRAEAQVARPLGDLVVYQQTWMSNLGKAVFGVQDVEVGDADFDGRFMVKATDADEARRMLDPPTRRALLDTFQMLGDVGIQNNAVVYQQEGGITGERAMELLLGLSTCAATLGVA